MIGFISIIFSIVLFIVISISNKKSEEKHTEITRYNNEVVKEYQYNGFEIKQIRSGEYLVEYRGKPVREQVNSIGTPCRGMYPLHKGFKYGKKISIEQVYRNLSIAKQIGYYC